MDERKKWKYCVVGNIVKTHIDENGVLRHGTSAFTGGAKVYLCGRLWPKSESSISVAGICRGKRWYVHDVPIHLIENVRCQRTFKPSVLKIMDDWEFYECWWHDTEEDRQATEEFVARWNRESVHPN